MERGPFRVSAQKRGDQNQSEVLVTFANNGPTVTSLAFEAAVPKYLQLQLQPASGNVVATGQVATQLLVVRNSAGGEKPILMKVRLNYEVEGQGRLPEYQGQVQFPM